MFKQNAASVKKTSNALLISYSYHHQYYYQEITRISPRGEIFWEFKFRRIQFISIIQFNSIQIKSIQINSSQVNSIFVDTIFSDPWVRPMSLTNNLSQSLPCCVKDRVVLNRAISTQLPITSCKEGQLSHGKARWFAYQIIGPRGMRLWY